MKSIDIFEPGDQFRVTKTGQFRTVWRVSTAILYTDTEGHPFMAEDVEQVQCLHSNAVKLAEFESVWDCPDGCGILFADEFRAFTADCLKNETDGGVSE